VLNVSYDDDAHSVELDCGRDSAMHTPAANAFKLWHYWYDDKSACSDDE